MHRIIRQDSCDAHPKRGLEWLQTLEKFECQFQYKIFDIKVQKYFEASRN